MFKKIFCVILCFSLISCTSTKEKENPQTNSPPREIEQGLVLYNATVEQANEAGETLWKLKAEKAIYSQDKKTAQLENITGNLFSKNKLILQVSAKKGEIKRDGKQIYLKENILALDTRNKIEFKSNELQWLPEENLLIVRQNITGNNAKIKVTAKEAIYHTEKQVVELIANIIATTKNPRLQMKTEHLFWLITPDKIIGDRPLEMTRFKDKIITDKLTTNQAELDLKTNIATVKGNINYQSLEPPLQAATSILTWQYKDRIIQGNQPIKLIQIKDNMTLTGNQANVNLAEKKAYLSKGTYGEAVKNEVKIYADNLAWNMTTEVMEATGNVFYQQINPEFNLRGIKAVGKLKDKSVIVTGDYQTKVITEIYPKE